MADIDITVITLIPIEAPVNEVFEKTARAKENAEKNLANAKELFESYLNNIFANPGKDWEEKRLGEVCEDILAGGDKPKDAFSKFKTNTFQILESVLVEKQTPT